MGNLHRQRRKVKQVARRTAEKAWDAAERGALGEAEKLIRAAVRARPQDPVLWNDLGLILWRKGELREAERAFRDALFLRADYEDGKMNLASLLASRGFFRQALRLEEELAAPGQPRAEHHKAKAAEYREAAERVTRERGTEEKQEKEEKEEDEPDAPL